MPIYLVTLSLQANHDYAVLWSALDGAKAQHVMDTTWLVDVSQNAITATDALLSYCQPGDRLFLLEFVAGAEWTGTGLTPDAKAWLGRRVTVAKPKRRSRRKSTMLHDGDAAARGPAN